ncbi:MAG: transcriptional repressor LexA [Planctomycetes bacterium]|nr:transcriptional repressor LexA [Planctomycetota bacterium]
MSPTAPLTRRQRDILQFLKTYVDEHELSPTLEEIAQHFQVNKVTIFGHVAELERKGFLTRAARGISRGLQLVEEQETSVATRPATPSTVAIVGDIAAGAPIEAIEAPEELDLLDLLPKDRDVYALRVRGDSMIEDAIRDGDLVLIERRETARNGETVVAILEDEGATLKRYYREGGRIRLQPANSAMQPIYVDQVAIRGVLIGVVRQF